jgi:hypothetical protein
MKYRRAITVMNVEERLRSLSWLPATRYSIEGTEKNTRNHSFEPEFERKANEFYLNALRMYMRDIT